MKPQAEFGVFGGSGFYSLFKGAKRLRLETPFGLPSGDVTISEIAGRGVAFLPRHGAKHQLPPHVVPYRANIAAFKQLGVRRIIGPCAVGSLQPDVEPGDIVVCDQFVNFTSGRKDTYFDGPVTTHVSSADPYCPEMRRVVIRSAKRLGLKVHPEGTVVVIQGPRFSSRAESRFFRAQGWHVINMTQYPEAILAREQELCYANVSLVTDYDAGLEGDPKVKPVSHESVMKVFNDNLQSLRSLIADVIETLPEKRGCACGAALEHARLTA